MATNMYVTLHYRVLGSGLYDKYTSNLVSLSISVIDFFFMGLHVYVSVLVESSLPLRNNCTVAVLRKVNLIVYWFCSHLYVKPLLMFVVLYFLICSVIVSKSGEII
ncbi:uncharacterized protein BX663DRAFT_544016, partial [Cokeromyces recurvatus]|uniref:uncharacterized protein n=1 Tax=Cokeromyces recurvatus TaxID=90255 RepID=UPI002220D7B9